MRVIPLLTAAALVSGIVSFAASPAVAKDGDVRVAGTCSAAVQSKLKAGARDGGIEAEFEVDSNRNGQTWTWSFTDNGVKVASGTARTGGRSGSFEVQRKIPNRAGADRIVARGANAATGKTCTAALTI